MSAELEVIEQAPRLGISLVSGPDPELAIAYARRAAKALQSVLEEGTGYVTISGRRHIRLEGWQVLAAATNHSIEIEWSRPMESPEGAWEARAVVRDALGQTVAAGESMASPDEKAPWTRNAFSIRSMAQTRAMVRAASSRLRYIPTLAGFEGTPAEEMPRESATPAPAPTPTKPKDKWAERWQILIDLFKDQHPRMPAVRRNEELIRTIKAAGVTTATELADDAKYADAHDAVSGIVGGVPSDEGGMPVADPLTDRMMGETDTKGVPWVDTLDAERDAKKKDEVLQGEVVEALGEEPAADAAWKASEPEA